MSVWTRIVEFATRIFSLHRKQQELEAQLAQVSEEIKSLSAQSDDLIKGMHRLAFELQRLSDRAEADRRERALELENAILKLERRLSEKKLQPGEER